MHLLSLLVTSMFLAARCLCTDLGTAAWLVAALMCGVWFVRWLLCPSVGEELDEAEYEVKRGRELSQREKRELILSVAQEIATEAPDAAAALRSALKPHRGRCHEGHQLAFLVARASRRAPVKASMLIDRLWRVVLPRRST